MKDLLLLLLKESVDKCYRDDRTLIDRGMEQASVARIFYYMQTALKNDARYENLSRFYLDNEYNKNGEHIKATLRCPKGTRPDIILHNRVSGHTANNLMVLEFKSCKGKFRKHQETNQPLDYVKLEDFTARDAYRFFLGVFVKLKKAGVDYKYFQNGRQLDEGDLRDE